MFTDEELDDIKWLAELVKAQATSERNSLVREYVGYNDRDWMQSKLIAVKAKVARCERVLAKFEGN